MASSRQDIHRLIHYSETAGLSDTTTGAGRVLLESCSRRLPFGWLFLFGSRNIWEPGQSIEARGGAAARRDPTITPMDSAQARLGEATSALRSDARLGAICAGLTLLVEVLGAAGVRGQLRLMSPPGSFGRKENAATKRHLLLEWVALAENVVFFLGQKDHEGVKHALESLDQHCAFVPSGEAARDVRELRKNAKGIGAGDRLEEAAVRLLIGWPPDPRTHQRFAARAAEVYGDCFQKPVPAPASKPWWAFWKKSA